MTCPFCKRDVENMITGESLVNIVDDVNVSIKYDIICPDCLSVAKHFLAKGLIAFGRSMRNMKGQIDMFPGDLFVHRDDISERLEER